MKKIIYILLFTISITYSFTAFSQNIDKRLIGKWKIKYEGNVEGIKELESVITKLRK